MRARKTIRQLQTLVTSVLVGEKVDLNATEQLLHQSPFMCSLFTALVLLLGTASSVTAASLPEHEWTILREVAAANELSKDETWLLAAIRLHENGRPGLEFGIGGPMNSGHRAHRYRDGVKSFRVQCAWAAGTIKRRYTGNLASFGKRYNPLDAAAWSKSVARLIVQLKRRHNGILPARAKTGP